MQTPQLLRGLIPLLKSPIKLIFQISNLAIKPIDLLALDHLLVSPFVVIICKVRLRHIMINAGPLGEIGSPPIAWGDDVGSAAILHFLQRNQVLP